MTVPVAVFASGSGTNLQALLDHEREEDAHYRVELVVSDRPEIPALERAQTAGRATAVVDAEGEDGGESDLMEALEAAQIQAVFLAGYLRLVPPALTRRFDGRILNVHPALLPAFGGKGMYGLRIHKAVLARGLRVTGVTVHFVNEEYDQGDVLAQWPVPVCPGDTPETLADRVLGVEHVLYPASADQLCRALAQGDAPEPMEPFSERFLLALDPPDYELRRQIRRAFPR